MSLLLVSCSKNRDLKDETEMQTDNIVSFLDFKGAESLVVIDEITNEEKTNLSKLLSNGELKEVFYLNSDGKAVLKNNGYINVNKIVDLTKDYVILSGYFTTKSVIEGDEITKSFSALMVRKSDGAIFDFGEFDFDMTANSNTSLLHRPNIFFDADSNVYYRSYNNQSGRKSITKLTLNDPNKILKEDYLPTSEDIEDATVDISSNVVYSVNPNDLYRVKSKSGSISFIQGGKVTDYKSTFVNEFWTGNNGKIYVSGYDNGLPYISIVDIENNNKHIKVWEGLNCADYYPNNCRTASKWLYIRSSFKNEFIFTSISGYLEASLNIWRFNENTNHVDYQEIKLQGLLPSQFRPIGKSTTGIYFKTETNDIYKYTFDKGSLAKYNIASLNGYEIKSIAVRYKDYLDLVALRYSDGKTIVGQIDNQGNFIVRVNNLEKYPVALERIN